MRVTSAVVAVALFFAAPPAVAQPSTASASQEPMVSADAYFEFMKARRLEADGDAAGALAALERAQKLDPGSAELLAERAALHARQNEGEPARIAAERALAIDPSNAEAHRILALVYSAWSDGAGTAPAGSTLATLRATAIEHLKAIRTSPVMTTDLGLQIA